MRMGLISSFDKDEVGLVGMLIPFDSKVMNTGSSNLAVMGIDKKLYYAPIGMRIYGAWSYAIGNTSSVLQLEVYSD